LLKNVIKADGVTKWLKNTALKMW